MVFAISSRPLFILILSPILFRHFQKFSKLLYPLQLHLPSIHRFTIRLEPVEHIMFLNSILRRIPLIGLYETNHLLILHYPLLVLCHCILSAFTLPCIYQFPIRLSQFCYISQILFYFPTVKRIYDYKMMSD